MTTSQISANDRGIAGGRDVIHSILVTGDHNIFFIGDYTRLRDAYITPWEIYDRLQVEHFVGRQWLLQAIDTFISQHDCGYIILEAEAGLGKTAFLAWLARQRGYIHHFVGAAPGTEKADICLLNLGAQLVLAYQLHHNILPDKYALPDPSKQPYLLSKLLKLASETLAKEEKIVIVIDGLDKANSVETMNVLGLPDILPENVYFLVSTRPGYVSLTPETPHQWLHILPGQKENLTDLQQYLQNLNLGLTRREMSALLSKCDGVWIYLHYILQEIKNGLRTPQSLDNLPIGLIEYYTKYWRKWQGEALWYDAYLPVLETLAAARQALPLERLLSWSGISLRKEVLRNLLGVKWRAFVGTTGNPSAPGYQFYHATLNEFFEGRWQVGSMADEPFVADLREHYQLARDRIFQVLEQEVGNANLTDKSRRAAALALTRYNWLSERFAISESGSLISAATLLSYLNLAGLFLELSTGEQADFSTPVLNLPEYQKGMAQIITALLEGPGLTESQQTGLLLYHAIISAQLGEIERDADKKSQLFEYARSDYLKVKPRLESAIAVGADLAASQRDYARVLLGIGNITLALGEQSADEQLDPTQVDIAQQYFQSAITAWESSGKQNTLLGVSIYEAKSYTFSLQEDWVNGINCYRDALRLLEPLQSTDSAAFAQFSAKILSTAVSIHVGRGSQARKKTEAAAAYQEGYTCAQQAIQLLEDGLSFTILMAVAHDNAATCLINLWETGGKSLLPEIPDTKQSARQHWQDAAELAHELGYIDVEQRCLANIEEYCKP